MSDEVKTIESPAPVSDVPVTVEEVVRVELGELQTFTARLVMEKGAALYQAAQQIRQDAEARAKQLEAKADAESIVAGQHVVRDVARTAGLDHDAYAPALERGKDGFPVAVLFTPLTAEQIAERAKAAPATPPKADPAEKAKAARKLVDERRERNAVERLAARAAAKNGGS